MILDVPFTLDTVDHDLLHINKLSDLNAKLAFDSTHVIRNRRRGLLLLAISFLQPVTRMGLQSLGYSKRMITSFTNEAKKEGIVREKGFLFSLTEDGVDVHKDIRKDAYLATWYNSFAHNSLKKTRVLKIINAGS